MIKVSIMYPNGQRQPLMLIIINSHLPMIAESLEALKGMEFNVGIGGRVPGELAPVAIGHLL
jgi:hypothetical protein